MGNKQLDRSASHGAANVLITHHQSLKLVLAFAISWLTICGNNGSLCAQSSSQIRFPYQAFVLHDNTKVHSGPGQVHYATQSLSEGAVVEVYRHDPGGWCQIRPVDGSFSLVPESTLEIVADGVGKIRADNTKAWVGTELGAVEKPLWQVKLQGGEMVEVLGQVSWPHPEGHSTVWFQIAPPAGEFRWVRMSDIQLPAGSSNESLGARSADSTQRTFTAQPPATAPTNNQPQMVLHAAPVTNVQELSRPNTPRHDIRTGSQIVQANQTFQSEQSVRANQTVRSLNAVIEQSTNEPYAYNQASSINPQIEARVEVDSSTGQMAYTENQVQQAALQTEQPLEQNRTVSKSGGNNSGWRQSTRAISTPPVGGYTESQTSFEDEFNRRSLQSKLQKNDSSLSTPNDSTLNDAKGDLSRQRFASSDLSAPNLAREFSSSLRNNALPTTNGETGRNLNPAAGLSSRTIAPGNISELEFQLTREMVKDPSAWQLADLEQAANSILRTTSNPVERSQTERYLTKLANCKQIQAGYSNVSRTGAGAANANQSGANVIGTGLNKDVQLGTTYDAHGWLTELVRDGGKSRSSYALQDANGKITHHIAPAPGMNIHRYLKKHVGIIGQRGYHRQLKLDHVTAQRIIEIQDSGTMIR